MADDSRIVVTFENHPVLNPSASKEKGRPVYDDMEVCRIRMAGDRQNAPVFPADAEAPGGMVDEDTGMTTPVTYKEKYARQYAQFQKGEQQTKTGTPIEYLPFLSPAKVKELKGLNIYTAEALAALDGQPLKSLGQGGREWKNQAQAYLDNAEGSALVTRQALEIEQLREQLELARKENQQLIPPATIDVEDGSANDVAGLSQFESWEDELIKEYIAERSGAKPRGNPNHKTLVSMADELANA